VAGRRRPYDDVILEHYAREAREHGLDRSSTMLDRVVRDRETQLIVQFAAGALERLQARQPARRRLSVCDVGCGNGHTLAVLRRHLPEQRFTGFEFTPNLRELAKARFAGTANVSIHPGDIRRLTGYDERFNVVICQRVLINLLHRRDQDTARRHLTRLLRPGGFLLSIEAYVEPLENLNAARAEFGLTPLKMAHHNLYLRAGFFDRERSLEPVPDMVTPNFLSSHFFIARLLHPVALGPNRPFMRNSHFVRFLSASLDGRAIGDYSPIKSRAFVKVTT
jgi:SAM-dependent methyltransferase